MKIIFVVDDNEINRVSAKAALEQHYAIYPLPSAAKMFKLLEKITPDLILLDIVMPEMDGFEAIKKLKADPVHGDIPVIFLTGRNSPEDEVKGFELGGIDFVTKPFSTPILIRRVESHLGTDRLIKESLGALNRLHNATISVIANLVESRDSVTGNHVERTQAYLEILVQELLRLNIYSEELSAWDMDLVLRSAQLHDVGKIMVSDSVLNKPGKLDKDEFELIKRHSADGEHIIDEIIKRTEADDFLRHAKQFAACHHEKWDGTGYPYGLKGEEIPLEGRIMAIADVYDALISVRPYKKAFTHEQAVEIIKNDAGKQFDPKIVEAFLNVEEDFWVESVRLNIDETKKQTEVPADQDPILL